MRMMRTLLTERACGRVSLLLTLQISYVKKFMPILTKLKKMQTMQQSDMRTNKAMSRYISILTKQSCFEERRLSRQSNGLKIVGSSNKYPHWNPHSEFMNRSTLVIVIETQIRRLMPRQPLPISTLCTFTNCMKADIQRHSLVCSLIVIGPFWQLRRFSSLFKFL